MAELRLRALSTEDMEPIRRWREQSLYGLRTPYHLTEEMQGTFYKEVVCNRAASHRYLAVEDGTNGLTGMVGLTNIQWENGLAEISLLTNPSAKRRGVGGQAVHLILTEAFDRYRLLTVCGECYFNNPATEFWKKIVGRYNGNYAVLPRRKFWDGRLWDALYFSIDVEGFRKASGEAVACSSGSAS